MLKSKELNLIIQHLKNPKKLYWGIFAALIGAGISAFVPYIYGRLVDVAVEPATSLAFIIKVLLAWLTLAIIRDLLDFFSTRQSYEVATDLTNNLEVEMVSHLLNMPMKFHKEKKTGEVMRKIDKGVDQIFNVLDSTVFSFFPDIISFVVAIAILMATEWRLAIVLSATSVCYVLVTWLYTKEIVKKQKVMHRAWEKAYGEMYDSVSNVQTVKATANELWERKKFSRSFKHAGVIFKNWRRVWQKMNIWQGLLFSTSFVVVFGMGVLMLRSGALTAGKLVMFAGYIGLLTSPLSRLSSQYRSVQSAIVAFRRAAKVYFTPAEEDSDSAVILKQMKGEVVFDNVSFNYKKDKLIIDSIFFKAEAGEKIAIVGESGVGKTTLVDLISRYYFATKGKIIIDGVNIKDIKLKFLRSQIALVPQEVMLFNDTIENNIKYGKPDATEEEIIEAAKASNAYEFIEKFPKKLKQMVGERGIKLSTGQKQRIAIARAIIRNPKILILDEATSALDSVSEKLVQEALEKLIFGRTAFIIAHRLSTIKNADKIIVLEKGRIIEMGNHAELIDNPHGVYRNFWELQSAIQKAN
ncbi:MAG: ABC transporter ATP-binding protein [bacterium]|nr:ABC transporter ATP-binding protein [bacterium]